MTAYVTRGPLQLINNPHMMSEMRGHGNGRRTSKRLEEKEDLPLINGVGHENEPVKGSKTDGGKQAKAKMNGPSTKPAVKRKPAYNYDEVDDGFAFTRTRAKKAKGEPALPPTVEEERQETRADSAPPKRTRKNSVGSPETAVAESEAKIGRRRSARHSGEHEKESADPPELQVKKRRKRGSGEPKPNQNGDPSKKESANETHRPPRQEEPQDHTQPIEITFDATKIALPFADTPRIQRNKDMRKTNAARRSSLGLRGRRASSLIDTGKSTAMPHDEVETSEFYKHIESEGLSEPRRMKQLLTWCGTRALGEKPSFASEDTNARLAAREIQIQLLKDFSKRSELSDWFNRNESAPPPSLPKPNPKNASNLAKIQDLEQQISRLRTERSTWETLLQPPAPPPTSPPSPTISPTLLTSPAQTSCLDALDPTASSSLPTTTSARLERITSTLEFAVDRFATNVHTLSAYKDAAEQVADDVLSLSAEELKRRDEEGWKRAAGATGDDGGGIGLRDVLRGLSRVAER